MRYVMRLLGQSPVIGKMIAGVLIGPSLLGAHAPTWFHSFFPQESRPILFSISLLGLTLYMFVVGLEFRADLFSKVFSHCRISFHSWYSGPLSAWRNSCFLALSSGRFFSDSISLPVRSPLQREVLTMRRPGSF